MSALIGGMLAESAHGADGEKLPAGFVYLRDFAPQIVQDIRYASDNNFVGRALPGYNAAECILREPAAKALARVQATLTKEGLGLKVYDCYRPARAVSAMMTWVAKGPSRTYYHPAIARQRLRDLGYIAGRSGHSLGTAVDLTMIVAGSAEAEQSPPPPGGSCIGPAEARERDGSVDMGTSFDCFDPKSHIDARGLTPPQRAARLRLRRAMNEQGFRSYAREWWHFAIAESPASEPMDFAIRPR